MSTQNFKTVFGSIACSHKEFETNLSTNENINIGKFDLNKILKTSSENKFSELLYICTDLHQSIPTLTIVDYHRASTLLLDTPQNNIYFGAVISFKDFPKLPMTSQVTEMFSKQLKAILGEKEKLNVLQNNNGQLEFRKSLNGSSGSPAHMDIGIYQKVLDFYQSRLNPSVTKVQDFHNKNSQGQDLVWLKISLNREAYTGINDILNLILTSNLHLLYSEILVSIQTEENNDYLLLDDHFNVKMYDLYSFIEKTNELIQRKFGEITVDIGKTFALQNISGAFTNYLEKFKLEREKNFNARKSEIESAFEKRKDEYLANAEQNKQRELDDYRAQKSREFDEFERNIHSQKLKDEDEKTAEFEAERKRIEAQRDKDIKEFNEKEAEYKAEKSQYESQLQDLNTQLQALNQENKELEQSISAKSQAYQSLLTAIDILKNSK